jgi:hypothetical protein
MVLQMIHIKKSLGGSANPQQQTANQVNLTIFLVSLLYLASVSTYFFIIAIEYHGMNVSPKDSAQSFANVVAISLYTLPLLNAALFPTILILRKADLRATYGNYILNVCCMPLTVFKKVRHQVQGRSGYIEI